MQRPVQITFRDMDPSDAVRARIEERVEGLEKVFDRLIGARVVVEQPHQRGRQGHLFHVTVELSVPGAPPLVVGHEQHGQHAHEDVYVAIRDVFDAARRRLEDHARKQRDDVKTHEVPAHGKVARKDSVGRHGFIETRDGADVFFHENALVDLDFDDLEVGTEVRFAMHEGEGAKGPQASTVKRVGKHHLPDVEVVPD